MEDGMVFRHPWRESRSRSGAPWPAEDEFEIGCTLEHAGYYLTWLCAIFGPASEVTAFGATLFPDKGSGSPPERIANDYSVTSLRFRDGGVARLTCGLAAPIDRGFHVQGEDGVVSVTDGWDYSSSVYLRSVDGGLNVGPDLYQRTVRRALRDQPMRHWYGRKIGAQDKAKHFPDFPSRMDFMRGPATLVSAIEDGAASPIPTDFSLHITELALVAQNPGRFPSPYRPRSTFAPLPAP
jgi:predicted dehydrogenase